MNLTEPQAGTDLGLIRTRATPNADGSYAITGSKIFISGGEHDLAENIVHLVLARIDGAPEGTKGISLFVVPKFLPDADGSLGARNTRRLRRHREEDGHPRQRHLRHELRRRHRLAGRRARQGPPRHVHDDERGAPRRRHPGPGALRGRLPERRRLCPRAPAGPGALRREGHGRAGRPDHRPSRHPPHARRDPAASTSPPARWRWPTALDADIALRSPDEKARAGGRRPPRPDDAGGQGRPHRPRLRQRRRRPAGLRRRTATSPRPAWSSSSATRASP